MQLEPMLVTTVVVLEPWGGSEDACLPFPGEESGWGFEIETAAVVLLSVHGGEMARSKTFNKAVTSLGLFNHHLSAHITVVCIAVCTTSLRILVCVCMFRHEDCHTQADI